MAKNNLIDIELIKQYVDITEEELMMRLVKDAVGLHKETERNKRRKEMEDISTCPSISQTMRLLQRRLVI